MTTNKPKLFNQSYQKNWSETHKYKHIHTGEYCTFEAYVAEFLVLRWTDQFQMDKPSYKFWTKGDKYHEYFIRNMKAVQSLKRKFSEEVILQAIRSEHFNNIYHIGLKAYGPRGWKYNKVAIKAIEQYNREAKEREKAIMESKEIVVEETEKPVVSRRTQTKAKQKSMFNKLRDL